MAKLKTISIALIILTVIFSGYIFAQTRPAPREGQGAGKDPRMEQGIDMMFQDMDTNRDGKISRDEFMAYQEKQFKRLDANGKGYITKDDVRADMEKMRQEAERMQQRGGKAPQ
jgi:hypothetical protein